MATDPIHQFQIVKFFPVLNLGGHDISFTNSAAFAAGFGSGDAAVASSATLASAASFPRDRRGTVTGAGGGANSASTVATQMAGTAVS